MTDPKQAHTPGPWRWIIHDHSMASLGTGDSPGMGDPLVLSVSPCKACADQASDKKWEWGRCCTPSQADAELIASAPGMFDELSRLRASNKQLREAGHKLSIEVLGTLPLMEPLCRQEFGNTNYALLIQRANELRAALTATADDRAQSDEGRR